MIAAFCLRVREFNRKVREVFAKGAEFRCVAFAALVLCLLFVPLVTAQTTHTVTNSNASGAGSLREILDSTGVLADDDIIEFDTAVNTIVVAPPTGYLLAVDNLTINGWNNGNAIIIDGSSFQIFNLGTGLHSFSLANITLRNGGNAATISGGAIYHDGTLLSLDSTTFYNNTAADNGGAVFFAAAATSTLTNTGNSQFFGNTVTGGGGRGGAIYAASNLTLTNTNGGTLTFTGNDAQQSGGAIYAAGALTLTNTGGGTIFIGNDAQQGGGAIYAGGNLTITANAQFAANTATNQGGAIYTAGNVTIGSMVAFSSNTANGGGGAIWLDADATQLSLDGTSFQSNTANGGGGGAVYFSNAYLATLTNTGNTQFFGNTANSSHGGAIVALNALTISNTGGGTITFRLNQSGGGGAIHAEGNLTIGSGVEFDRNNAEGGSGGAIYLGGTTLSLNGTLFQRNSATFSGGGGGAVHFGSTTPPTLTNTGNTRFIRNTATAQGGAIYTTGDLTLTNTGAGTIAFSGNMASVGGAIVAHNNLTIGSGVTFGGANATDGNTAEQGGAIYLSGTQLSLNGTLFQNNSATGSTVTAGGAMSLSGGDTAVTNTGTTQFIGNTATNQGGAIYANGTLLFTGTGTLAFSGNTASEGGAIYADGNITLNAGLTLKGDIDTDIWTPTFILNNGATLEFDLTNAMPTTATPTTTNLIITGAVDNIGTTNVNFLDWETGEFRLITAASGVDGGSWLLHYRGFEVAPDEAVLMIDSTMLRLTVFDTPDVPVIIWDGRDPHDPHGMIWDEDSVDEDVLVMINRPETEVITLEGEDDTVITIAGLQIGRAGETTLRTARRGGTGVLRGRANPELEHLAANGRLVIEGGIVELDIETDFEYGTILGGGTVVRPGRNRTFGTFVQNDDIENSQGQVIVDEGAAAVIEVMDSLDDVQNRFLVKEGAQLTIAVAEGEELNIKGVVVEGDDDLLHNGGAIVLLENSTLTLEGNINITGNSTELAGGGIFVDPAMVIFDSTKGHTAIFGNLAKGEPNAIALHGDENVLKFIGGDKALPGGVDIRDSVIALPGSTGNVVEIDYTNAADFVQFGKAEHDLGLLSTVSVIKGGMRLVEKGEFNAGAEIDVAEEGILAGGGTFTADDFTIRGTLRPDHAVLTSSSSIIGSDKLVGVMALDGDVTLNGAKISVELRGSDSDLVEIDGNLTGTGNTVDINAWNEGTFTVLTANSVNENDFSITVGGEVLGIGNDYRQTAGLVSSGGNSLTVTTFMDDADRRRLTWIGNGSAGDAPMYLGMNATGDWYGAERFQHTDYLVFNETGQSGTIVLGSADGSVGGRTVSGMLISDGEYNFTGGDLFGIAASFGVGNSAEGSLLIAGGNVGFANNVYFEGNIEILNRAHVTLTEQKAFHTEGDFILKEHASLTLAVGDDLIKGETVLLDGTVNLTDEPLPTSKRPWVFNNMIVAAGGTLEGDRLEELFDFTQGLLNRKAEPVGGAMNLRYTATPLSEYAAANSFSRNASELARYFEQVFDNWEWEVFEESLMRMTDDELAELFAALESGAFHAEAKMMALSNPYRFISRHFLDGDGAAMMRGQEPCSPVVRYRHRYSTQGIWLATHHTEMQQSGDGQARQYGLSRTGINFGIDRRIHRGLHSGLLFTYNTPVVYQEGSRIKAHDYTIGLYTRKRFNNAWEAAGFAATGFQNYTGKRRTLDGMATSKYDGNSWHLTGELIRRMKLSPEYTLLPTLAMDFQTAKTNAFAERGSAEYNQAYKKSTLSQTVMRFGLNSQWQRNDRSRIDTRLQYGRQIGGSDTPSIQSVFVGSSVDTPIRFNGVALGRDILNVGAGGRYFLTSAKNSMIFGNYDFDRGNRSLSHTAEFGFQYLR